jgi:uncharacterized protein YaeQ
VTAGFIFKLVGFSAENRYDACHTYFLPLEVTHMALTATILKAKVSIVDLDNHVYLNDIPLTLAQHPSETENRVMLRLLAWMLNVDADTRLSFTKGLCQDDEPDIWFKSDIDAIEHWIDLGQPSEKRLKKACNQAQRVTLYTYGDRSAPLWFKKLKYSADNLSIQFIDDATAEQIAALYSRNMELQLMIQDGEIQLLAEGVSINIKPQVWC